MAQNGLLNCFVKLLDRDDIQLLEDSLMGINNILHCGANYAKIKNLPENFFLAKFEKLNGIEKIKKSQTHPNQTVHSKAREILENHFKLST